MKLSKPLPPHDPTPKPISTRPRGFSSWITAIPYGAVGVYVILSRRTRQILYVGESHSYHTDSRGNIRGGLRKTLTRHFQGSRQGQKKANRKFGHKYFDRARCDGFVLFTRPEDAVDAQCEFLELLNRLGYGDSLNNGVDYR